MSIWQRLFGSRQEDRRDPAEFLRNLSDAREFHSLGQVDLAGRRYEEAYRSVPIAFKADVDHSWAALASQSWTQCRSAEAAALFEKAFRKIKT